MEIDKLFDIKDKIVVVPGGNGKLGMFVSKALSEKGAKVIILGRNNKSEKNAINILRNSYFYKCDITNEKEIEKVSKKIIDKFKRVDVLINCAGLSMPGKIFELTTEMWDDSYAVNIKGAFLCVKYFGEIMRKQKKGNIIHFGSIYGSVSSDENIYSDGKFESSLIYATTKSALINFTRYLATHLSKYGIRANLLSPGGFIDERNKDEFFRKKYCEKTPLGRMADEDDLKGVILFLASDASRYITGENILVDGGWTAW